MVTGFINWNIDPEIIKLFGVISLRYYGLLFVTGLFLGYYIVKRIYIKENLPIENLEKLAVDFLKRAQAKADSLENTANWRKDAEYPGGQSEMLKFISKKLSSSALNINDIKTKLYVEIDIDSTGNVTNTVIRRGINESFDKSVISIIN